MKNQTVAELIINQIVSTYNILNGYPFEFLDKKTREEFENNILNKGLQLFRFVVNLNIMKGLLWHPNDMGIIIKMKTIKEEFNETQNI